MINNIQRLIQTRQIAKAKSVRCQLCSTGRFEESIEMKRKKKIAIQGLGGKWKM